MPEKILIIKHGALGDWILATGAFKLIRKHHPNAHLVLLTGSAYVSLAKESGCFDDIWIDNRKRSFIFFKLIYKIWKNKFDFIYDLQRSQRTHLYYQMLLGPKPFWSGKIKNTPGYFVDEPEKHIVERMSLQLQASHIMDFPTPDISWLKADITPIKPAKAYVLIIPGCAKHRPKKRWTVEAYVEMIEWLAQKGIQSVLIGTEADREIIDSITAKTKTEELLNLINKTSFSELAELARHALCNIGSDTGSMHIAAATGSASLTLFCLTESNPKLSKAWGDSAKVIEVQDLQTLSTDDVKKTLDGLIRTV